VTGVPPGEQSVRDGAFGRVDVTRVLVPRERDPLTGRLTSAGHDRPGKRRQSTDHARSRPRVSRGIVAGGVVVGVLAVAGVAVALTSGSGHKAAVSVQSPTPTGQLGGPPTPTRPADTTFDPGFKMRPVGKGIQAVSYVAEGAPQPLVPYSMPFWFTCNKHGCVLTQNTSNLPIHGTTISGRIIEQGQECPGSLYDTYDLHVTKFVDVVGVRVPGAVAGTITRTGKSCHGGPSTEVVGRGATELASEGTNAYG